jgi:hypothetical protein
MSQTKNTTSTTRDQDLAALVTPDGRYFVVRGRLWRATNPSLSKEQRQSLVKILMDARRSKGAAMRANDTEGRERARLAVEDAKRRLGERGEVWWTDGSPDYNRYLVKNSPYSSWYENLSR